MKKKIIASLLIATTILGNASTVALATDSLKVESTAEQQSSPRAVFFESDVKYSIEMIEHYFWIFENHLIFQPGWSYHATTQRLKRDFLVPSKENFEAYLGNGQKETLEDGIGYFINFCAFFREPMTSPVSIIKLGINQYRSFEADRTFIYDFWKKVHGYN